MLSQPIWHIDEILSFIAQFLDRIFSRLWKQHLRVWKKNHWCNSRTTGVIKPQINQWVKTEETALPQKLFELMRGIFEHSDVFKVLLQCTNRKCYFFHKCNTRCWGRGGGAVRVCYNDREVRRWHVLFLRATAHDWPWTACDGKMSQSQWGHQVSTSIKREMLTIITQINSPAPWWWCTTDGRRKLPCLQLPKQTVTNLTNQPVFTPCIIYSGDQN